MSTNNDDLEPWFVGTFHVTDDSGEYINNPEVAHLWTPGGPMISIYDLDAPWVFS